MADLFDFFLFAFTFIFGGVLLLNYILTKVNPFYTNDGRTLFIPGFLYGVSKNYFFVIAFVFVFRSFIYEPYKIPSGSMYPTLHVNDFILVNKHKYGLRSPIDGFLVNLSEPKRGDIIVFKYPAAPSVRFVKRIIGLPGDKIAYKKDTIYINGNPVQKKYVREFYDIYGGEEYSGTTNIYKETIKRKDGTSVSYNVLNDPVNGSRDLNEVVIPKNEYFVMGDNRSNSMDSRFWGFLPFDNIIGKAEYIWISFDKGIKRGIDTSRISSIIPHTEDK